MVPVTIPFHFPFIGIHNNLTAIKDCVGSAEINVD